MARIPDAELERLKREISVERLAEARGIELRRHGKDLLGLCPFHDDKEPSLVITPEKNLWHCLGACQAGGSVIDWVMKAEGVSFRHAVEILRKDSFSLVASSGSSAGRPPKRSSLPKLEAPVAFDAGDSELLSQVIDYYHETLKESPEALAYLEQRGLVHPEMIEHFRLGYANRTLGLRLPAKDRKAGEEIRGRLQRVGIVRSSGHEHFNGSLVIPVFGGPGSSGSLGSDTQVVEVYGRKITRGLRKGTPLHLYLPGPHRGVWNLDALAASKEIILCESLIDALTFWCAGFRNVTASYGIEGFTEEHSQAFEAYGTERVLIAYDRDEAGERAAEKLAEKLIAKGIACHRVRFPKGMDANEYALKVSPAERSLDLVLRKAEWMGEGEAPERMSVAQRAVVAPLAEKKRAAKEERPEALSSLAAKSSFSSEESAPPELSEPAEPAEPSEPDESALAVSSPRPEAPVLEIPTEVKDREIEIRLGDRRYRVRGLERNLSYDVMKVNVLASRGDGFHVDTLDLYSARHRGQFVREVASELGVEPRVAKRDVGRVLLKLEELQDEAIRKTLEPAATHPEMSPQEREEALALLRAPDLLERIVEDFSRCGVVGEETNKLTGYLATVSRKLARPLAVILQSSSAAGKSVLLDAVLSFVPEEERVAYSAMTGQSLFYMGETDLKHKVLAIAEEKGAERASYALKLLQSEGELTIASTGKDPASGKLVTHEYRVEGPVAILLTTTAIDVDEELLNRCLVLTVDEEREQTRAIHERQREQRTLEGLLAGEDRKRLTTLHQNAQRLLRSLRVVNPYAGKLTFLDTQTRTRRDHEKYLALIDAIALVHQHQREVKRVEHGNRTIEYIEVTPSDIETANRLAHEVLGRSLDELPPQTRRLLELLDELVCAECETQKIDRPDVRFTRRAVREATGWSYAQVRTHLDRLVELEYVLVHRGGRGQSFVYELIYDGGGGNGVSFLPSLIGAEALVCARAATASLTPDESSLRGEEGKFDRPLTPHCAPIDPPLRSGDSSTPTGGNGGFEADSPENAHLGLERTPPSYVEVRRTGSSSALLPLAARPDGGR